MGVTGGLGGGLQFQLCVLQRGQSSNQILGIYSPLKSWKAQMNMEKNFTNRCITKVQQSYPIDTYRRMVVVGARDRRGGVGS